ncbi:hypothetical protein [Bacteroides sp. 51]|uniref:hypothetical protein n=1 Tax=Bacteroides sp. 51 TaxID=2302938 RepID=UPI0013D005FF|nr:hypothetical protein [Bacteroides sp. 51]NDV83250.1 hypothetical protein [Bacteroides sp. 51]
MGKDIYTGRTHRIAKNTLMLYIRMVLVMLVSLYTSRIILEVLGVEDFGIYNVVGGVVSFLAFFISSLSNATQRYLNIGLGKNDLMETRNVFKQSVVLYFIFSVAVLLIGESVGLWFVLNKLTIPTDRIVAVQWVFHFSMINIFVAINQVSFISAIVAREQMSVYAYLGLFEAIAKLLIVFLLLTVTTIDRLILYSALLSAISIIIFLFYIFYCVRRFEECRIGVYWNKALVNELFHFIGYNLFGCFSWSIGIQGINVILNIFFGPMANAARAIAMQVNAAITRLTENLFVAIKPQIIKAYTTEDTGFMNRLLEKSSVYSYILMLFLTIPLLSNTEYVLTLWLKNVPKYTVVFTQLIMLESIFGVFGNPLWLVANATGKIRNIQVYGRFITLSSLPISYVLLKCFPEPIIPIVVQVIMQLLYVAYSLYDIHNQVAYSYQKYFKNVLLPVLKITLFVVTVNVIPYFFLEEGFTRLISMIIITILSLVLFIYLFLLESSEKYIIIKLFHYCPLKSGRLKIK